jgi:PAS domain S-box-containing protein
MAKPIHVLVVEDSEDDTLLLMKELKRNGFEPSHQRVETARDMESALHNRRWDVVISDYTMPQFNGSDALKLFAGLKLDIPFIFVSGTHGEEAAVRMIKAGADDYFVKGRLARLAPAIEREMESAQRRREQARNEERLHQLAAIVESCQDAVYSMDSHGVITSWNPAAERIYGYRPQEIIGMSGAILCPDELQAELQLALDQIQNGRLSGCFETTRRRKDGSVFSASLTASQVKNPEGNVIGVSVIARDITLQKQQEEDRSQLIGELTAALRHVKTLAGLLPVCPSCKRVRDEDGAWVQVEAFISKKSDATVTNNLCPECGRIFNVEAERLGASNLPLEVGKFADDLDFSSY